MKKINDLSQSKLRKKYLDQTFVAESSLAVCMGRVSTKDQKTEGRSDEAQLERIEEYAMESNLKLVKAWDVAETASKHEKRKHFIELLQFVTKSQKTSSPIKHIIFSHQSRSNRNRKSARILEDLIREHNVALHCVRDRLVLTNKSPQENWLLWDFFNNFNENFIKEHIRNVMDGTIKRLESGLYPCRAPMGYKNVRRNGLSIFEVDQDTAPLIIKLFELFSTGRYSIPKLKEEAESLQKTKFHKARFPGMKYIDSLLRNPFYYGDFIYDKTLFKGNPLYHPPIISFDLWNKVQDVLNGKEEAHTKWCKERPAYLGLVRCGGDIYNDAKEPTGEKCGYAITSEIKRKKLKNGDYSYHHYWLCSNNRKGHCTQRDPEHLKLFGAKRHLKQDVLEEMMSDILSPFQYSDEASGKMIKIYRDYCTQENEKKASSIKKISVRLDEIQKLISTSYEDKLNNLIPEDLWKEKYQKWLKEQGELKKMLSSLSEGENDIELGINCIELAKGLYYQYKQSNAETRRKILDTVASNLVLTNLNIGFDYKKPWSLLPKKWEEERWWR